jgi:3-oxoacyl-[acyl-carrier protein] reductase
MAAIQFARHGVTINGVEPGNIMTPGTEGQLGADYIRAQEQSISMGRLGDPEDIAYAMLFLAGDEAKYITGQTIVVDGGQTLPESRFAVS